MSVLEKIAIILVLMCVVDKAFGQQLTVHSDNLIPSKSEIKKYCHGCSKTEVNDIYDDILYQVRIHELNEVLGTRKVKN